MRKIASTVALPGAGPLQAEIVRRDRELARAINDLAADAWSDLRFPATSINPVGLTGGATVVDVETTYPGCLNFSGSLDQMIAGVAQLDHGYKHGSSLSPHIHWTKPTGSSSAVTWNFYYRLLGNVGGPIATWQGPFSGTLVAGDQTISNRHLLTSFDEIPMPDMVGSAMLAWRIYRLGSSDAESNDVVLFEFDLHYQIDKRGSVNEIPDLPPAKVLNAGLGVLTITGAVPGVKRDWTVPAGVGALTISGAVPQVVKTP